MSTVASSPRLTTERMDRIEISATLAITAEAAVLRATGAKLVDFGAGEPHFSTPAHIKAAGIRAIEENFTRYTAVGGIPELRRAIVGGLHGARQSGGTRQWHEDRRIHQPGNLCAGRRFGLLGGFS